MTSQDIKYTFVTGKEEIKNMSSKSDPKPPSAQDKTIRNQGEYNATCDNSADFDFKSYVPYQLGLENSGLFPEFYFHFKKSFGNESAEKQAYCSGDLKEIASSDSSLDTDFALKFRQCLHPDLRKEFSDWKFSRNCVENQFREKLDEKSDFISAAIRLEQLNHQIRKDWIVEPMVDFLTAFGHTELSIWTHLIQAYAASAVKHPKNRKALRAAAEWKTELGTLSRRAQAFANLYKASARITKKNKIREDFVEMLSYTFLTFSCVLLFLVLISITVGIVYLVCTGLGI